MDVDYDGDRKIKDFSWIFTLINWVGCNDIDCNEINRLGCVWGQN